MQTGFPDQRTSDSRIRYAPGEGKDRDAIVVEFLFTGTQKGTYRGTPPTGKKVSCRMTAFFFFPAGSDRLADERVYFDAGTILMQLGVIAKLYQGWSGPLPRCTSTAEAGSWDSAAGCAERAKRESQQPTSAGADVGKVHGARDGVELDVWGSNERRGDRLHELSDMGGGEVAP